MLWSLLCVATDVNVSEVTHIAGEDNENCDRLSRRGKTARAFVAKGASDMGLGAVSVIGFETDETVMEILRLCDPRIDLTTETDLIRFWSQARVAIHAFTTRHGEPGTPTVRTYHRQLTAYYEAWTPSPTTLFEHLITRSITPNPTRRRV